MLGSSSDSSLLAMARVAQGEFAPIEERPAKRPRPRSQEGGALEKDWKAPLHQKFLAAAEHGNAASMATLLANPLMRDVNMRSARGLTALHIAVERGHAHIVEQLLMDGRVDVALEKRTRSHGVHARLRDELLESSVPRLGGCARAATRHRR